MVANRSASQWTYRSPRDSASEWQSSHRRWLQYYGHGSEYGIVRSRECARRAISAEPANETSIRSIPIRLSKYARNQLHRSKHNESRNRPKQLVKPRHGHRGLARPLSGYGWDG